MVRNDLLTVNKIATTYKMGKDTVLRVLEETHTDPDGTVGRWAGYSKDSWETALDTYYKEIGEVQREKEESDSDIRRRINLAKAEELELKNAEKKGKLVSRESAERFVQFVIRLFASKLEDICRSNRQEELYNSAVNSAMKEIDGYLTDTGFSYEVPSANKKQIETIVQEPTSETNIEPDEYVI